jgi:hypothetical protein
MADSSQGHTSWQAFALTTLVSKQGRHSARAASTCRAKVASHPTMPLSNAAQGSPVRSKLPDSFRLHVNTRPAQPLSLCASMAQASANAFLNQRSFKLVILSVRLFPGKKPDQSPVLPCTHACRHSLGRIPRCSNRGPVEARRPGARNTDTALTHCADDLEH